MTRIAQALKVIAEHRLEAALGIVFALFLGLTFSHFQRATAAAPVFSPPAMEEIPAGPEGDAIRHGYEIVVNTQQHVKPYLGSTLSCRNCHLDAGRVPYAGPFVGVYTALPEYRARNAKMNTIEIRINDCFERSMNGKPLPYDSGEMGALVSYMAWMSKGIPAKTKIPERGFGSITLNRPGDPAKGKSLFVAKCVSCHGADGHGTEVAPPLWGPKSYNKGAGITRISAAASFIKRNMPPGQGGTLTDEEAYDLATFVNSQPRPEFPNRVNDWPTGGKPDDMGYWQEGSGRQE